VRWMWTDTSQVVWNSAMALVFVVAIVAVCLPRSRPLRQGWKSTTLWIVSFLLTGSILGYVIPLGAIAVLWSLWTGWKELDSNEASPDDHLSACASSPSSL
jgi:hypothetical protein